jgi:hypothetical protein
MEVHTGTCGYQQLTCQFPGCEMRFPRAEKQKHFDESKDRHLQCAWSQLGQMQERITALEQQKRTMYHTFSWYSACKDAATIVMSDKFSFGGGLIGRCFSDTRPGVGALTEYHGSFQLLEGTLCTANVWVQIVGVDDRVAVNDRPKRLVASLKAGQEAQFLKWSMPLHLIDKTVRSDGSVHFRVHVSLQFIK